MEKIRLAKEKDLPRIMKLFRRVKVSMESLGVYCWSDPHYPTEEDFLDDIKAQHAYILTDDGLIKGYAAISLNPLETFYPVSHDETKLIDLLSDLGSDGYEETIVLERLMVDPGYQKHGYGEELVKSLESQYPHRLWIALLYKDNTPAFPFYEKTGWKQAGYHKFEYEKVQDFLVIYKRP